MTRIVKEAEVRREELLDIALELFMANGYERTSVEQITRAADVAKGTFYHYFESKQGLLTQLVERFADAVFSEVERALEACGGTAIERFKTLVAASSQAKLGRRDETLMLTSSLYTDDNRMLRDGLRDGWIQRARPLILSIVEQGTAEGVFEVPDVPAMTDVWLSLWFDHGMYVGELFLRAQRDPALIDELLGAMDALVLAEERILGAKPGSLGMDVGPVLREILSGTR